MADPVTVYQWIDRIQTTVLAVGTLVAASYIRVFKTGAWSTSNENRIKALEVHVPENLDYRLKGLENRMDRAGLETSRLATEVQGLPQRIREEFHTRERASDLEDARLLDSANLWRAIKSLEDAVRVRRR